MSNGATRLASAPRFQDGQSFRDFRYSPERAAKIVAAQGEFHGGFEEAEFVAGIVALAIELEGVDGTAAELVAAGRQ